MPDRRFAHLAHRYSRVARLAALAAVIVCLPAASVANAAASQANGPILYSPGELKTVEGATTALGFPLGSDARFAADGAKLAYISSCLDGGGCALNVATNTGTVKQLAYFDDVLTSIDWSPNGSRLVVGVQDMQTGNSVIQLVDTSTGEVTPLLTEGAAVDTIYTQDLEWQPDGSAVAFSGLVPGEKASEILTVDTSTGQVNRFAAIPSGCSDTSCHLVQTSNPSWSPDGSSIAALVRETRYTDPLDQADVEDYLATIQPGATSAQKRVTFSDPSDSTDPPLGGAPLWSPDGTKILYAVEVDGFVDDRLYDTATGSTRAIPEPTNGGGYYVDWQPCPGGVCAPWAVSLLPPAPELPVIVAPTTPPPAAPAAALPAPVPAAAAPGRTLIRAASSGADGGKSTATARWQAPSDLGYPASIVAFKVMALRLGKSGAVIARKTTGVPGSARKSSLRLKEGRYKFSVAAVNATGRGTWSARSKTVQAR